MITRLTLGPVLERHTVGLLGTCVPVSFGRFPEISCLGLECCWLASELGSSDTIRYHFVEMFIFALMGIAAGLLGATFNHFNRSITRHAL